MPIIEREPMFDGDGHIFKIDNVRVKHCALWKPNTKYKPEWCVVIVLPPDMVDQFYRAGFHLVKDQDGDVTVRARRYCSIQNGENLEPPEVVDADAKPWPESRGLVGNGSRCNVRVKAKYQPSPQSGEVCALYLIGLQILDLVPYVPSGESSFSPTQGDTAGWSNNNFHQQSGGGGNFNQNQGGGFNPNQGQDRSYNPNQGGVFNQNQGGGFNPNQGQDRSYNPNQGQGRDFNPNQGQDRSYNPNQGGGFNQNQGQEGQHYDPNQSGGRERQQTFNQNQGQGQGYNPNQGQGSDPNRTYTPYDDHNQSPPQNPPQHGFASEKQNDNRSGGFGGSSGYPYNGTGDDVPF